MNGLNLRAWGGLTQNASVLLRCGQHREGDKWLPFSHPAAINRRLQMNSHVRPLHSPSIASLFQYLLYFHLLSDFARVSQDSIIVFYPAPARARGKGGTNPVRKDRNSMVDCALNHFKGGVRNGGIRGSLSSSQPARSFWCLHLRNERLFLTLPLSRSFESRRKERSLATFTRRLPFWILSIFPPSFLPRICINKLVIRGGT